MSKDESVAPSHHPSLMIPFEPDEVPTVENLTRLFGEVQRQLDALRQHVFEIELRTVKRDLDEAPTQGPESDA